MRHVGAKVRAVDMRVCQKGQLLEWCAIIIHICAIVLPRYTSRDQYIHVHQCSPVFTQRLEEVL
jgi:hypothetical protein